MPEKVPPLADVGDAKWYVESLRAWPEPGNVVRLWSFLPPLFDRYVRIFHPARRLHPPVDVRWSDICLGNGRVAHARMQWPRISSNASGGDSGSPRWDEPPLQGELPADLRSRLVRQLRLHTESGADAFHCVWDGTVPTTAFPEAQRLTATHRRYLVFCSDLSDGPPAEAPQGGRLITNAWWPADRRWCVATDLDWHSTYVGCDRACAAGIFELGLEAAFVGIDDRIDEGSDRLNR